MFEFPEYNVMTSRVYPVQEYPVFAPFEIISIS